MVQVLPSCLMTIVDSSSGSLIPLSATSMTFFAIISVIGMQQIAAFRSISYQTYEPDSALDVEPSCTGSMALAISIIFRAAVPRLAKGRSAANPDLPMHILPAHKAAGVREAIEARRKASLAAQIFARPESDRDVFQQAQGRPAQGSRTDNSASAPPDRPLRARTDGARSVKLFQPCRLCVKSTGICSSSDPSC